MIDFLARSENSKRIFPTVMEYSTKFVQGAAPGPRIAAVKAIAVCVEGCATYMRKMLDQIFTLVSHEAFLPCTGLQSFSYSDMHPSVVSRDE
jgi:hypothetical protein